LAGFRRSESSVFWIAGTAGSPGAAVRCRGRAQVASLAQKKMAIKKKARKKIQVFASIMFSNVAGRVALRKLSPAMPNDSAATGRAYDL
jgi:hypothetical protein